MKKVYVVFEGSVRDSGDGYETMDYVERIDKIFENKEKALCYMIFKTNLIPDDYSVIRYNTYVSKYDPDKTCYDFHRLEEFEVED